MEFPKFSVLMSVYIKEHADYLDACMESIVNQTVRPSEIVIVYDGPVTDELREVVGRYDAAYPELIKVVANPVNKGLGPALADGVAACTYDLIARMDTDDIARRDRFEQQLNRFVNDPGLDICGSHIIEFDETMTHQLAARKVPLTHDRIAVYQRQRSAFNHVTVMFKKDAVLRAGNYQDAPLMEDDYMWIHMLQTGAKCANIDDYLVNVRTGYAMIERRGGWAYFLKYRSGRRKILATGYISYWDYIKTIGAQLIVAMIPAKLRLFVFTKLLRR